MDTGYLGVQYTYEERNDADADDQGETTVDFFNTERLCIASLRGVMANRFLDLMRLTKESQISAPDYNCVGAVHFLTGASPHPQDAECLSMPGTKAEDVSKDMHKTTLPLIFQIDGKALEGVPSGKGNKWTEGLLHTGFCIAELGDDDFVVLDKDGGHPLRLTSWKDVYRKYFPGTSKRFATGVRIAEVKINNCVALRAPCEVT